MISGTFTTGVVWVLFCLCVSVRCAGPPVLVDVDAGVDDAFALAVLLQAEARGQLSLLGVTTVSGNTGVSNVTVNVLKLLHTAGRLDVPVYSGAEHAIEDDPERDYFFGNDGFGDIDYPNPPNSSLVKPTHAVQALIDHANQLRGQLVLICLGPLTNFALAARMDSTFSSKLARVVVLGGSVEGVGNVRPGVEFNFYWDPMAAYVVFSQPHPAPITLVTWETASIAAALPLEWRRDVLGAVEGPVMTLLNAAEEYSLGGFGNLWVSSDLLAACLYVNSALITVTQLHHVAVEPHASKLEGAAIVDYYDRELPNSVIVKTIDLSAYQAMLLDYLES